MAIDLMEKVHWTENPLNYIVNFKGTLNIRFGITKPTGLQLGKNIVNVNLRKTSFAKFFIFLLIAYDNKKLMYTRIGTFGLSLCHQLSN